jgi:hypothetical protein
MTSQYERRDDLGTSANRIEPADEMTPIRSRNTEQVCTAGVVGSATPPNMGLRPPPQHGAGRQGQQHSSGEEVDT